MASSALTDSSQVVVVVEEVMGNPVAHMEALKVATGDAMMVIICCFTTLV